MMLVCIAPVNKQNVVSLMSLASRREQTDATAFLTVLFRSDLETISAEEPIAFRPDSSNSTVRPSIFSQTFGEQWSRSLGGRRVRLKKCVTRYRDLAAQCTDDRFCDKMRTRLHGHFIKESQGRRNNGDLSRVSDGWNGLDPRLWSLSLQ